MLTHRRGLAALFAALAVAATLRAQASPPPAQTEVLTASHDIAGGAVLRAGDLEQTAFAPSSVPAGVVVSARRAIGRTTTGPVRRGEPITDVRLLTDGLLTHYPGLAAVPVRVGDRGAVRLLRVGDRVDLLSVDPQTGDPARLIGSDVPVLAIPRAGGDATGLSDGGVDGALVVFGLPEGSVGSVARASVTSYVSVVLRG